MRLYNNLVAGEKVRINPRGFVFEDVEACAGELMRFEGGDEGVAVEDSAAGGVDEVGVGFHLGEFGFANHVMGVFGERAVQGDDVGSLEKLLERLACQSSFRRAGRDSTVSRKILYLHAQRCSFASQSTTDASHTDDSQFETIEISRERKSASPVTCAEAFFGASRVAQVREHEEHGHVCRGIAGGVASVGKPNVLSGHPVDMEIVVSALCGDDDLQLRKQRCEQLSIERFKGLWSESTDHSCIGSSRCDEWSQLIDQFCSCRHIQYLRNFI